MNNNLPKSKILSSCGLFPLLNVWVVAICVINMLFFSSCVTTSQDWDINSDFEEEESGQPIGWTYNVSAEEGYSMVLDSQVRRSGNYALRIQADADSPHVWAGAATRQIPVWFKMRDVRLRGYVKWKAVSEGFAGLWCRVERWDGISRYEQQGNFENNESEDWGWYEIPVPVDEQARQIQFGGLLRGPGTVWLDSLTLEVDGMPYPEAAKSAAQTLEKILVPSLEKQVQPLGSILSDPRFQSSKLVVLNLADMGSRPLLEVARDMYRRGEFDQLLINVGDLELAALRQQYGTGALPDSQAFTDLISWQVKSRDFWDILTQEGNVQGIDLGTADAAIDVLRPYLHETDANRLDSLHQALFYQIGRSFISPDDVDALSHIQESLMEGLPKSTYPAQQRLRNLTAYYRTNGSSFQRNVSLYQTLDSLTQSVSGRSLFITWETLMYRNDPDLIGLLRKNMGDQTFVIGATVGEGKRLESSGEMTALPPLLPAAHEYYLAKLNRPAVWMSLSDENPLPWLPRQMFWRQSLFDSGYTTVRLQDFFDAVIYLDQSWPAQAL